MCEIVAGVVNPVQLSLTVMVLSSAPRVTDPNPVALEAVGGVSCAAVRWAKNTSDPVNAAAFAVAAAFAGAAGFAVPAAEATPGRNAVIRAIPATTNGTAHPRCRLLPERDDRTYRPLCGFHQRRPPDDCPRVLIETIAFAADLD
jgi:hypothetical protein